MSHVCHHSINNLPHLGQIRHFVWCGIIWGWSCLLGTAGQLPSCCVFTQWRPSLSRHVVSNSMMRPTASPLLSVTGERCLHSTRMHLLHWGRCPRFACVYLQTNCWSHRQKSSSEWLWHLLASQSWSVYGWLGKMASHQMVLCWSTQWWLASCTADLGCRGGAHPGTGRLIRDCGGSLSWCSSWTDSESKGTNKSHVSTDQSCLALLMNPLLLFRSFCFTRQLRNQFSISAHFAFYLAL